MVNFIENAPKFCYRKLFQNCTSLIKAPLLPALSLNQYCYAAMFSHTSIKKAPELPATSISYYCYSYMFEYTPIINAPELPATTLKTACYQYMFLNCENLINGPSELPALTLILNCYNAMFKYCKNLENPPELMFTSLVQTTCNAMFENCYKLSYLKVHLESWGNWSASDGNNGGNNYWMSHVNQNGTFVCPQSLSEVRSTSNIPLYWTIERF